MRLGKWGQIDRLFQATPGWKPDGCAAFLETACRYDEGVYQEVEELLAAQGRVMNFISNPTMVVATKEINAGQTVPLMAKNVDIDLNINGAGREARFDW